MPYLTRHMPLPKQAIIDQETRRLQLSFSSEEPCLRQTAFNDPWIEILGHNDGESDLSRLNAGAAVLYDHNAHRPDYHLGIVEKAWVADKRGQAIIRLSKRRALEGLWEDIQAGILTHISVGYLSTQRRLLPRSKEQRVDSYRITHWQPHEISLVTLPADLSVGIGRSDTINFNGSTPSMENQQETQAAIKDTRSVGNQALPDNKSTETKETILSANTKQADLAQDKKNTQDTLLETRSLDTQAIKTATLEAERQRRHTIRELFTPYQDKRMLCERCLDDPQITVDNARQLLLDDLGQASLKANIDSSTLITCDPRDKFRQGVENALLCRAGLAELDHNNDFQHYTLVEIARACLHQASRSTTALDSMTLVGRAFTHSSADFPAILSHVANKALLKGYQEIQETFPLWTSTGSLSDFKVSSRVDLTNLPSLKEIPEGAEYQYVTLGDREQTLQLATYGAMFSITRQAIINDDLHAFTRIPHKMGQAAQRTIGNLVYAILIDNPKMSDKLPLFAKEHRNIATKKQGLTTESLNAARVAMATQKLGHDTLHIRPTYFIVPVALQGRANVLMASDTDLDQPNSRVPNAVRDLAQVIADPRLDDHSTTTWYLIANPAQYDVLEVAYLDGKQQPTLEEQPGWLIDGMTYKVRLDAGVQALDHRSFYRGECA